MAFSLDKIIISEKVPHALAFDCTFMPPAVFRKIMRSDIVVQYNEVYVDVDTVSLALITLAMEAFDEDRLYIYSSRWESRELAASNNDVFFHALCYLPPKHEGDAPALFLVDEDGNVLDRKSLYKSKGARPRGFGLKHFFIDPMPVKICHSFEKGKLDARRDSEFHKAYAS